MTKAKDTKPWEIRADVSRKMARQGPTVEVDFRNKALFITGNSCVVAK